MYTPSVWQLEAERLADLADLRWHEAHDITERQTEYYSHHLKPSLELDINTILQKGNQSDGKKETATKVAQGTSR